MTRRSIEPRNIPQVVHDAAENLRRAGGEAFVVGGAVRDVLLGKTPGDFDLATNLLPKKVATLFPFTVPTGIAHGTISVWMNSSGAGKPIEVTTYRADVGYSDGRRPDQVEFKSKIEDDLARRDFTINAIAYDPAADRLVDPYGGQTDLDGKVLRAVGAAVQRFSEDGLRPMRAVRFAAQLGFQIEARTFSAIGETLDVVRRVSVERLRDELLKILDTDKPSIAFELMRTSGLLAIVLPELLEGVGMHQNHFHKYSVYDHTIACIDAAVGRTARLGALFHDIAKPRTVAPKEGAPGENTFYRHDHVGADLTDQILRRLRFSNEERELIVALVKNHMFWYDPAWSDGAVRRFVGRVGEERLEPLFDLRAADIVGRGQGEDPRSELEPLKTRITDVLSKSRAVKVTDLAIDGNDVMQALALKPSRIVRDVLEALLERESRA